MDSPRVVVVGASSGMGRCIGTGLGQRGARVALLARRLDRLERAAAEAGEGAIAIECDVTDPDSCATAIGDAAESLGGIDALVYTPALGVLAPIEETDQETWRRVFDTNVTGAALVTAAALPHLKASGGSAMFLSSVSASQTPPWQGLSTYAVSKAAMDKLVDAWREEHPDVGFTRIIVGECAGGEGEAVTGFADDWDREVVGDYVGGWISRGYMTGNLMDVENLVHTVDMIARTDPSVCLRSVTVAPRLVIPDVYPERPQ